MRASKITDEKAHDVDAPIPYRLTAYGAIELAHARALDAWVGHVEDGILPFDEATSRAAAARRRGLLGRADRGER